MTASSDGKTYTYNVLNQLVQFSNPTAGYSQVKYLYDPNGLRTAKNVNNFAEFYRYVWDGDQLAYEYVGETDTSPAYEKVYNRGHSLISSTCQDMTTQNVEYYLYEKDAHGDIIFPLDANSTSLPATNLHEYEAFGNFSDHSYRQEETFLGYSGEYHDKETGFIYLRARYYDPENGRFINEDPIRDGLNWYVYCNNNPVRFVDPSGLDAIIITNENAVGTAGHTSALYQDDSGNWYYTYWGISGAAVVYVPETYTDTNGEEKYSMSSLDNFNEMLEIKYGKYNIGGNYNSATYIEGDFTAALDDAIEDVYDSEARFLNTVTDSFSDDKSVVLSGWNTNYVLIGNNCLQNTLNNFAHGTLANGMCLYSYLAKHYIFI